MFWLQFLPESPSLSVSQGDFKGALRTLEQIARMNGATMPEGRLVTRAEHVSTACMVLVHLFGTGLYVNFLNTWHVDGYAHELKPHHGRRQKGS